MVRFFKSKPTVFKFNNGDLVTHKTNPNVVWVVTQSFKNLDSDVCCILTRVRDSGKKDSINVCEFELEAAK